MSLKLLSYADDADDTVPLDQWKDRGDFIEQALSGMRCDKVKPGFRLSGYQILPRVPKGTSLNCHYQGHAAVVTIMASYRPRANSPDNQTISLPEDQLDAFFQEGIGALKLVYSTNDVSAPPMTSEGSSVGQKGATFELLPIELSFDPYPHGTLWVDMHGYWLLSVRATYPKEAGTVVADLAEELLEQAKANTQNGILVSVVE